VTAPIATTVVAGAPPPSPAPSPPPSPLQPGQSQAFSVGFQFETNANPFNEGSAKDAIAAQLAGVSPGHVTIGVTGSPPNQLVTVSIYAADAAKAQSVAEEMNTLNDDTLSAALSAPGSVSSLTEAEVKVTTHAAPSPPLASPPPSVIAIASSPPPSASPAPPPPPSLPDGLVAVATHKFTLKATDTATRRRRLAQITTENVKEKVLALLDADPAFKVSWLVGEKVTVTGGETADAQSQRTFDVQIVALKAHSEELDQLIKADAFATTLASPAYLGTTVAVSGIEEPVYSNVRTSAPPGGGQDTTAASPPPPAEEPERGALVGLGESNVTVQNDDAYWAFLPCGLLLICPLIIWIYVRSRYGGGKTMKWLRWKCSHTNPVTPILYLPKDVKERMRVELHSSEV